MSPLRPRLTNRFLRITGVIGAVLVGWVAAFAIYGTFLAEIAPRWSDNLFRGLLLVSGPTAGCLTTWWIGRPSDKPHCPTCGASIDASGACCCIRCTRAISSIVLLTRPVRSHRWLVHGIGLLAGSVAVGALVGSSAGAGTMTACVLLGIALFLLTAWVLGDGRRDLCRCQRCAYDMISASFHQCPECGRRVPSPAALFRSRRLPIHRNLALLLLMLSAIAFRVDAVRESGWRGGIPTTVLVIGFEHMPDSLLYVDRERIDLESQDGTLEARAELWDWQASVLRRKFAAQFEQTDDPRVLLGLLRMMWTKDLSLPDEMTSRVVDVLVSGLMSDDRALRDETGQITRATMSNLETIGEDRLAGAIHPHIDDLLEMMVNRPADTPATKHSARAVAHLLGHATSDTPRVATSAWEHLSDSRTRFTAFFTLLTLSRHSPEAFEILVSSVTSGDPNDRYNAITLLTAAGTQQDRATLCDMIDEVMRTDDAPTVVAAALEFLEQNFRFDESIHWLLDEAEAGRWDRAVTIGQYPKNLLLEHWDRIIALMHSDSPTTRACGCAIIRQIETNAPGTTWLDDSQLDRVRTIASQPAGTIDQAEAVRLANVLGLSVPDNAG